MRAVSHAKTISLIAAAERALAEQLLAAHRVYSSVIEKERAEHATTRAELHQLASEIARLSTIVAAIPAPAEA